MKIMDIKKIFGIYRNQAVVNQSEEENLQKDQTIVEEYLYFYG